MLWNRHMLDCIKVPLQMGSRQSSGGSQAGPRQGPLSNEGGAARGKGHRRTASSGQGTATAGDSGPEWTEEVDQVPQCASAIIQCCCLSLSLHKAQHSAIGHLPSCRKGTILSHMRNRRSQGVIYDNVRSFRYHLW